MARIRCGFSSIHSGPLVMLTTKTRSIPELGSWWSRAASSPARPACRGGLDHLCTVEVDDVISRGGWFPIWRSVAPVPYSEIDFQLTWIAVARPDVTFVEVADRPECPACHGDPPPEPSAVASGVGEGRVGPWPNTGVAYITIAAAAPVSTSTCGFKITNLNGQPMFFDEAAVDYVEGFVPGVSPGTDAEVWLDVTGECAWAIKVVVAED